MDYESFIRTVEQAANIGWEDAERATRVTLETLGERIARGEADDLAAELPPEVAPWIATTTDAEGFDVDEFLRRVAEREDVDLELAARHVKAVFTALGRAVKPQEMSDLAAELSKDYAPFLPQGPHVEVVPPEVFLERVANRAGLDVEHAERLVNGVLQTLAERIAGGEVEDLKARLDVRFHVALEQGLKRSHGKATRIPLEEFVRRAAERSGLPAGTLEEFQRAHDYVRAVLTTLREAVGDDEFSDVRDELPSEYDALLAR
jgi:uncharacterized protein (DUF2267 family)